MISHFEGSHTSKSVIDTPVSLLDSYSCCIFCNNCWCCSGNSFMIDSQSHRLHMYCIPSYISPDSSAEISSILSRGIIVPSLKIFADSRLSFSLSSCLDSGRLYTDQGPIDIIIVKRVITAGIYPRYFFWEKIKYTEITSNHRPNTTTKYLFTVISYCPILRKIA